MNDDALADVCPEAALLRRLFWWAVANRRYAIAAIARRWLAAHEAACGKGKENQDG